LWQNQVVATEQLGAARHLPLLLRLGIGLVLSAASLFAPLTSAGAFVAGLWWLLPLAAIPAYLVLVRYAGRLLWPDDPPWKVTARIAAGGVLTAGVAVVGLFVIQFWFVYGQNLCGKDGSSTSGAGGSAAFGVYLVGGVAACLGPVRRVTWLLPVSLAIGWVVAAAVTYAIPSNHGSYCES
jgi:hypothetical protein